MLILLTSDLHIFTTKPKRIRKMFRYIRSLPRQPDLIVLGGDLAGGLNGASALEEALALLRLFFPLVPVVAVLGNHEFWLVGRRLTAREAKAIGQVIGPFGEVWKYARPSSQAFEENVEKMIASFARHGVHFLDEDGPWRSPSFPGVCVFGATLWYASSNPPTKDLLSLPVGFSHGAFARERELKLDAACAQLTPEDKVRVFVSHFPVVNMAESDLPYGGNGRIGEIMREHFGVRMFLNGHFHRRHEGPERFECGSDYHDPRFLFVDVPAAETNT